MLNTQTYEQIDFGQRVDWLENQLEIVYEYEQAQANEIISLKEVIRKLFTSHDALVNSLCELTVHIERTRNHA